MKIINLIPLMLFFVALFSAAQAQTQFTIDGLNYTVIRGDMVSVSSDWLYMILRDTVVIPEYVTHDGETYHVSKLENEAFVNQRLTHITLPQSIGEISENCFYHSYLKTIDLPPNLFSIRQAAFYDTKIDSFCVPSTVHNIDYQAFFLAHSLQKITVETGNNRYCSVDGVLYNYDTTVLHTYPAGKTDTTFYVPESVREIALGAFGGNTYIRHVYLPESVEEIGNMAFVQCSNMVSVNIPANAVIEGNPFPWCPRLEDVVVDSNNSHLRYIPSEQALVSFDGDTLYYKAMDFGTLTIPEGVRYIAPYALAYHWKESEVVIREGVEELARCAFFSISARKVELPSSLRIIGEECFAHCYHIARLDIQEGLEEMGPGAFSVCITLPSVELPNSLKRIPETAFAGCNALENVLLGDSTEHIGYYAFVGCQLTQSNPLTFPSTLRTIEDSAFYRTKVTQVIFTGEVDSIGNGAFSVESPGINSLTLVQKTPPHIGNNVFNFAKDYVINIPCGSSNRYRNAPHWRDYDNYEFECEDIDETNDGPVRVYAAKGFIMVEGAAGQQVEIYNATGILIAQCAATDDIHRFSVSATGLYLVRIGHQTHKVVVR